MPRYGETLARKRGPHMLTKQVTHADLTAAAVSEVLDFGAIPIPPNSIVCGVRVKLATPFSGGTVSNMAVRLGSTADDDAIVATANLFAAAADGYASAMTLGAAPFKKFASATQLKATFVATGDNVVNLSAGDCTIELDYIIDQG
jgi:hypothetical protein